MIDIIQQRLESYQAASPAEEEQATKEILQEIALYVLWRAGFFEVAAFQGGTSLRILHKLPRFSEDLDFILKSTDRSFEWSVYLRQLVMGLEEFGLIAEVLDKSKMDRAVRQAVLRDDSISHQLNLKFYRGRTHPALKIKMEVDVNPPEGSGFTYSFLDFPLDFSVCHQDLASNLALKIHALLCRPYVKGRDWYDFNWYAKQRIQPNIPHLRAALHQYGPWKAERPDIGIDWMRRALEEKIANIDWKATASDVERFLGPAERQSLTLWGEEFFRRKVQQMLDSP